MAGGGYSLLEYETKQEAIQQAKAKLEMTGDAISKDGVFDIDRALPQARPRSPRTKTEPQESVRTVR